MEDNKDRSQVRKGSPFHTTDAILAFSLYLVGVPFYEDRKPCLNMYDEGILKKLGFAGMNIEEGVRAAVAKKKKGHVVYGFQRTPELQYLLTAYKQQEDQLRLDEGTANVVFKKLLLDLEDGWNPMTVVRLLCVVLKIRVQFVNIWQVIDPLIRVWNEGEVQTTSDEDGVPLKRRFPGFRLVGLSASQATKDKLKL